MSQAAPPVLTVRYDGSQRTFAAGHDVVVGRDLRADMRITHPLISRAHLLLRFEQGRWLAIDNGSLNGTYVNGRRVPVIDIHDGQTINIGNPDGPQLTFEVGRHDGHVGRPPQTTSMPIASPPVPAAAGTAPATAVTPAARAEAARASSAAGAAAGATRGATAAGLSTRRRSAAAGVSAGLPGQPPPHQPAATDRQPPAPPPNFQPKTEMAPPRPASRPKSGNLATKMIQAILPGSADTGQAAGIGHDRSRQRQRHRHPGRAGVASSRVPGRFAARHRDPGRPQRQRHLRQRRARRLGGAQRGRRGHDRQHRPGLHRRQPDPPHRSRDPHRWPGGQRRALQDRRQGTAGQHLADGAAGHADRDHRGLRCGQDHAVAADRRIHPPQRRQRSPSRATTSTPSTRRCAAGSGWCRRTMWCTAS